ncbi:hypothetical protein [Phormidium tenue]|nr:hypothetical protein [Phormidium tenue]
MGPSRSKPGDRPSGGILNPEYLPMITALSAALRSLHYQPRL